MEDRLILAKQMAQDAGKLLMKLYLQKRQIKYKSASDFVTDADFASENYLISQIKKNFPTDAILTEETGKHTAANITSESSNILWIIDPLDGTINYGHQYPHFSISIAVQKNQEIICGVVYDPVQAELFWSYLGKGAFLNASNPIAKASNQPISVSKVADLSKAFLCTGLPNEVAQNPEQYLSPYVCLSQITGTMRRTGSAALDLCYVACGRFDGMWEDGLSVWDIAAGYLILIEAGGLCTDFKGNKPALEKGQILASNGLIHDALLTYF